MAKPKVPAKSPHAESYKHPEAKSLMRPDVGTQAQFKKKKPPRTYRYDSSLSPALDWDGQNPAREQGEALIQQILEAEKLDVAKTSAAKLKALSKPFLNWAGKAERLSFDVPTLPLFVHERLSTKAIVETLGGHKRDKQQTMFELFGDPQHSITDQILRAYEYQDDWVNRMILGDSLVVMNSLLHYEGLGEQVQMAFPDISILLGLIKEKKLKALAVTSAARHPQLPDVPTMAESGIADYVTTFWTGVMAPAGTPASIVGALNTAIAGGLRTPQMQENFTRIGAQPAPGTPADFASFIAAESRKWNAIAKTAGIDAQ